MSERSVNMKNPGGAKIPVGANKDTMSVPCEINNDKSDRVESLKSRL